MKKSLIILLLSLTTSVLLSQSYSFDSIPGNLKNRADAVIRSEQCLYTILKPGNAVMKIKKAVTLLNDDSRGYRLLTVYYDKFSKVNYLKGSIYDEKGKMIRTLGIMDLYDMSAITGSSFYSDDRMKIMRFPLYKYPYTIEYEYEIEFTSLINYPSWNFQDSPDVSVEKSGIQYVVPENMKLRYYGVNLKNPVDSVLSNGFKIFTWQEENLTAVSYPQNYARIEGNTPVLYTAPLDFEFGGFKGSMGSWKSFGDWVYNLTNGLDVLPETEQKAIEELVSKTSDPRERVRLIYEYMQSRTRYVSIQIGIGGFRPAEASAVSKNGFGDCKALVNYTMALLKAAKINSVYTLVLAGDEESQLNRDFVNNQFNHVILCVPMQQDSIWLDCTDPTLPFNFLGNFTADRYALLITPEGGKLARTPGYRKTDNILSRTGSVFLNVLGASSGKISNSYSGYYYSIASSLFGKESEEEMKRYLYSVLKFPDFNVTTVSYKENKTEKPTSVFNYSLTVSDFGVRNGQRIYFNPSVSKEEYILDFPSALEIVESQIVSDSISYNLPLGYQVDYLPEKVIIENEFGNYRYQLDIVRDKIVYKRYLELEKCKIPIERFDAFRSFINSVAKSDRDRIILKKSS